MSSSQNFQLLIAYDGTDFSGWQRQKKDRTIQGEIESCLKHMTQEDISLHGAGRTDAGVHADGMVASFLSTSKISPANFIRGLNSMLPGAIRILEVNRATTDFHARYSAKGKRYQYTIFLGKIQPPTKRLYALHIRDSLDIELMNSCLKLVEGTHDYSSFENSGSRDKSCTSGRGAIRTISEASLSHNKETHLLTIQFIGDGFLRNMVRNMVGALLAVGRRRITLKEFENILGAKDRTLAPPTVQSNGLCLKEVFY